MKHNARGLLSVGVVVGALAMAGDALASPTINWNGTTDGDPSTIYYNDCSGYTPYGKVQVGTWDGYTSTWTAWATVYADSSGDVTAGSFPADCADGNDQWLLGWDFDTSTYGGYWYVRSNCIE
jgi:hypothetical protein